MGDPDSFVVLNADMMGDYPLREFVEFHMQHIGEHSVLATEVHSFARNNFFLQYNHKITHSFPVRLTLAQQNSECIWLAPQLTEWKFFGKVVLMQKYLMQGT